MKIVLEFNVRKKQMEVNSHEGSKHLLECN